MRKCRICKKKVRGRSDKLYCSISCKNQYHHRLRKSTLEASVNIDAILHRNRSILLELLGKRKGRRKVSRILLDKKKFTYKYHTHIHINSKGKTYHYVYDFAWMEFSDDEILIVA